MLDRVAYRTHAFAFPIWTFAALIAGPIWAHYAWGRYWGWDPKEVWAFITWVVYAAYLHARATSGWKGRSAAIVALVGLATLWFNFVGINFFFGSGSQHSYAAPEPAAVVRMLSAGRRLGVDGRARRRAAVLCRRLRVELAQEVFVVVGPDGPPRDGLRAVFRRRPCVVRGARRTRRPPPRRGRGRPRTGAWLQRKWCAVGVRSNGLLDACTVGG